MEQKPELTYSEALAELEEIIRKIQSDNCDIDSLAAMTRRASELLAFCRSRLTATEAELKAILDGGDESCRRD